LNKRIKELEKELDRLARRAEVENSNVFVVEAVRETMKELDNLYMKMEGGVQHDERDYERRNTV